jgi:preprotein translocase subunit YajC
MLISPAYAQAGGAIGGSDMFVQLLPLVLIFVVFWFFLIRPQQKRAKEHREMIAAVRRGDQVVTGGGMIGKVTKVIDDNTVQVELSENVRVKVVRSTLTDVLSKTEPAKGGGKTDSDDSDKDDTGATAGEEKEKKSLFSFGSKK